MRLHLIALCLSLGGCSSLRSLPLPPGGAVEGLAYHLPRRDIQVTVTVNSEGGVTGFTIDRSAAYADTSKAFLLKFSGSLIGESKLDIGVTNDGLLQRTHGTTTPKLLEALESAAALTDGIKAARIGDTASTCTSQGAHVFVIEVPVRGDNRPPAEQTDICGGAYTVTVQPLVHEGFDKIKDVEHDATEFGVSGIYFRQSLPYRVQVKAQKQALAAAIVLSPSASPTRFLPVERTLFSHNDANLTLDDGELTGAVQSTDGELAALIKLPAGILKAYFSAVGGVFAGFQAKDTAEASALAASVQLELAKNKHKTCMAAMKAGQVELAKTLGCGEE